MFQKKQRWAEVDRELQCFRRSSVGQKLTESLSVSEEAALQRLSYVARVQGRCRRPD